MATNYVLPQVQVFQQFQQIAAAVTVQLPAFIFGPNYALFRYGVADEKIKAAIGAYDYAAGNTAVWPNKPVGSVVDQAWTRLFMDNGWLEYYEEFVGGGVSIHGYVNPVTDRVYRNRIYSPTLLFASYGSWARSAAFKNRDVKAGDGVILHGTYAGSEYTVTTRVTRLINDVLPSVIAATAADPSNAPSTVANITETVVAGSITDISEVASGTYDGIAAGHTSESYVLTVTVPGPFGTARFAVASASGTDTPVDPILPQAGIAADVGTRGLQVTFSVSGSAPYFDVGYMLRIDVQQNWTPAVSSDAGVYTGANDGTYIVQVTKGGLWAALPQVFVSSTGTLDSSGPYEVADDTFITLPTGVQVKFNGAGLVKGDRYYIDVTASAAGPIHTLELANSLPLELFGILSESDTPAPVDLDLSLSIVKNIEVLRTRSGIVPNWDTTATEISVYPGILSTDSTWTDTLGNLIDMPVIAGSMYVQYRSLIQTYVNTFDTITDIGDVETRLGPAVEENPLSLGVFKAVQNAGSVPVGFMATGGGMDDLAAYLAVLDKIYDREDTYGLVPLTHNKDIQDAVLASALTASTPERGRWRVMWTAAVITEQSAVETVDDHGNMLLGTIGDDPDTSGTQYTYLNCDAANFISAGVLPGQTVRTSYIINPSTGEEQYAEYIIDAVVSEEYLRLATGPSLPITVPSRFEIWKDNTTDDMARQVIDFAGSFGNRRARVVLPDKIGNGGTMMDGMFACCALAGLRSGSLPHQGLTNVQITGFDDVSRVTKLFGGRQLDDMAAAGTWIITTDDTGTIYSRHQLTTDMSDVNTREDSVVSNVDAISYLTLRFFRNARYIGRRNITPGLLAQLDADFDGLIVGLVAETNATVLGPQLISATIVKLERHPTLLDRVVAQVNVELPYPFNNFDITIFVLAS